MAEAEGAVDPELMAELEGQLEAARAEAEAAAAAQAEAEAAAAAAEEAAAAAAAAAAEPEAEDIPTTLVIAQDRDPQRLDPNFVRGVEPETIAQTMYDSLIALDTAAVPVPSLASSWSFPDDSRMVLELREGVQFHNGEPFNAESVKGQRREDPIRGARLAPAQPVPLDRLRRDRRRPQRRVPPEPVPRRTCSTPSPG